jgi:hypothetical protein
MSDPVQTQGGGLGHIIRRLIHVSMVFVPWCYYSFSVPRYIPWVVIAVVVVLEAWRLSAGVLLFGQRANEVKRISAFAWGAVSLSIVLLSTTSQFAYPIIASCALADPLIGEMRRRRWSAYWVGWLGLLLLAIIWGVAVRYWELSWWWVVVMAPLTVAAEWPNWPWIDDNGLMQLVPLFVVLLVNGWF